MNVIGYIRVSSEEQVENYSLANQEEYITNFCAKNKFTLIKIFRDEGKSAKNTNRQGLQRMLEFASDKKNEVNALAVYKIDRLSRETSDFLDIKRQIQLNQISLISVTEPMDSSPMGEFMETLVAAQAKLDNRMKSQRTIDGMTKRLEAGLPTNPPSNGYKFENNTVGKNNVVRDEPRFSLLQKAGREYLKGIYNFSQIAKMLNSWGYVTKKGSLADEKSVGNFLRNKYYAGIIYSKPRKKEFLGSYEAMFNIEEWLKIQQIIIGKTKSAKPKLRNNPDFPLRNFSLCCNCGKKLSGAWSKGRNSLYAYYFCPSCKKSIRKMRLEDEFLDLLFLLTPKPETIEIFANTLYAKYNQKVLNSSDERTLIKKRITDLNVTKSALIEKNLRGVYSDELFTEMLKKLKEELDGLTIQLSSLDEEILTIDDLIGFSKKFLSDLRTTWNVADLQTKQRLQQAIFPKGITYLNPGIRTADICCLFKVIGKSELENRNMGWCTGVEPAKTASTGQRLSRSAHTTKI